MRFLTSDEIHGKLKEVVSQAQKSVLVASAWIKVGLFDEILDIVKEKLSEDFRFEVVLRASEFSDLQITDEEVIKNIKEAGGRIYICKRLHAKFLLVDGRSAVVGSSNFTNSGLSEMASGNIEAAVYYESPEEEVRRLEQYFRQIIKEDHSEELREDLIGFVINPARIQEFEIALLEQDICSEDHVELGSNEGRVLARILDIQSYDMGFFANPFKGNNFDIFAPIQDFETVFSDKNDKDWRKAASFAYKNGNGKTVRIARAKALCIIREKALESLRAPIEVGSAVYKASDTALERLLKSNISGERMRCPVKVGKLLSRSAEVFVDADQALTKHTIIVGSTGSGKSYFTKLFLSRVAELRQVFVFDPHGEYYEELAERLGVDAVRELCFEDVFLPNDQESIVSLIKEAGYPNLASGNSNNARENNSVLSKYVSEIRQAVLGDAISEVRQLEDMLRGLKFGEVNESNESNIVNYIKTAYGEHYIKGQKETVENIKNAVALKSKIVVINLKKISSAETRVYVAGLLMKKLFMACKNDGKPRLLVLEESHNFAPERGYGDASSGEDNLALVSARTIASEGRKFNLGMVVITQRPAQVSKYVISQMNTQVMFRTFNKNDLDTLATLLEYAGEEVIRLLTALDTGSAVITGVGVRMPTVFRVE